MIVGWVFLSSIAGQLNERLKLKHPSMSNDELRQWLNADELARLVMLLSR